MAFAFLRQPRREPAPPAPSTVHPLPIGSLSSSLARPLPPASLRLTSTLPCSWLKDLVRPCLCLLAWQLGLRLSPSGRNDLLAHLAAGVCEGDLSPLLPHSLHTNPNKPFGLQKKLAPLTQ
jgi:hypothetical protein